MPLLVKLNVVQGDFVWAKSIGGTTIDEGLAIQLDAGENVYVAGKNWWSRFDPGAGILDRYIHWLQGYFYL
ncbi:MAG: hypothetical protein U5K54_22630 [Cytophagales bacterium]|nr:hypothetical protein [Cytophagales bacterium]